MQSQNDEYNVTQCQAIVRQTIAITYENMTSFPITQSRNEFNWIHNLILIPLLEAVWHSG